MKISILLPYKENFSPTYAGAVSLFVKDTVKLSEYKKYITVFGNTNLKNIFKLTYKNIDLKKNLIQSGIDEGATLVAGGPNRPEGLDKGYFVRPTIFTDVSNNMRIAKEEIFGPVLSIIPFDTEEEAIAITNDTSYGLGNYVQTQDKEKARRVAKKFRSGGVYINGKSADAGTPFGGYRQSGNGREGGTWGIEEYLEVKTISGWK